MQLLAVPRSVQVANYTTSPTTMTFNFTSFDGSGGANLLYSWNLGVNPNGAEVIAQQVNRADAVREPWLYARQHTL